MTAGSAPAVEARTDRTRSVRAMASPVTLRVEWPGARAEASLDRAEEVFRTVERTCSRFDPASDLSRANAAPDRWHEVSATLAVVIEEAARAHRETGGVFDPRILGTLLGWGYDRSLPFADGDVARDGAADGDAGVRTPEADPRTRWRPEVVREGGAYRVHLGPLPIDLGGIGKGLAVRWAAEALTGAGEGALVDAGGDGAVAGTGPAAGAWRIGVEDPAGGSEPLLVLELTDTGYATSSTWLRRWRAGGRPVHHLVDPQTGRPGGDGLVAVTVVAPDPAWSEVWSKTLFLAGAAGIRARAEELGAAAAWVDDEGRLGTTAAMDATVIWRSAHV